MCQWCNHRFQARKILIWVKHLPILPPKFFIEVKHNKIMGPLRGDAGTKQKSYVKYFISLWGSFIIFSFFKKGVDISKWSGINEFNFTFIEGSSAIFYTPWIDHLSGEQHYPAYLHHYNFFDSHLFHCFNLSFSLFTWSNTLPRSPFSQAPLSFWFVSIFS